MVSQICIPTQERGNEVVSADNDWNGWIAFFLKAIMQLYDAMKIRIHEVAHSQYSVYLLDALFNNPTFRTSDVANKLKQEYKIHEKTTRDLLKQLKEAGAL
jgi:hypothetical protein